MTALRDAALAAEQDTARKARDQRAAERFANLDALREHWDERATLTYKGDPLPMPERMDGFTWHPYPGVPYQDGRGRNPTVHGWAWDTDGITFTYSPDHGLCVILTCPDCGEQHADHAYGLDGLGKLLRLGRSTNHVCREISTRDLAHAIRDAAERTKLDPHTIAALAADREEAYPRR